MKPTWDEATRRLADHPSITGCTSCKLFPWAPYRRAAQRVVQRASGTAEEQFLPTASGTFQFVRVWCLWARTYCWDSLLNSDCEATSHELAVCESDSRCSTWISASGSALLILTLGTQTGCFLPKDDFSQCFFQICCITKDIYMKALDRSPASIREGVWCRPQDFDCFSPYLKRHHSDLQSVCPVSWHRAPHCCCHSSLPPSVNTALSHPTSRQRAMCLTRTSSRRAAWKTSTPAISSVSPHSLATATLQTHKVA